VMVLRWCSDVRRLTSTAGAELGRRPVVSARRVRIRVAVCARTPWTSHNAKARRSTNHT